MKHIVGAAVTGVLLVVASISYGIENPVVRQIVPSPEAGKAVPRDVMERVYEQVKTPYKYGVILAGENGAMVDCPSVLQRQATTA